MIAFDRLYRQYLKQESNILRRAYGLPDVSGWLEWQASANMNIAFWPKWFSPASEGWLKPIKNVGFPLNNLTANKNDCRNIDDCLFCGEKKPVLITGGTGKMLRSEFYSVCVEACNLSGQNAILLTRYPEMVPHNLPDSIRWMRYIPNLGEKMSSMLAVIHHGGIGTLSSAALAGIPQLILGDYVDRPFNGARAKELEIAEYLPPAFWTPKNVSKLLDKITSNSSIIRCKTFSSAVMQKADTIEYICELLESIINDKNYTLTVPRDRNLNEQLVTNKKMLCEKLSRLSVAERKLLLKKIL